MSGHGVDILFAVSPTNARQEYMPFYFLYLAGYLEEQGRRVSIADPHEESWDANVAAILAAIDRDRPRMVGLAAFVTDYDAIVRLAAAIKAHVDVPIVVGNAHPSVNPHDFLYDGAPFDLVVRGEGELTLLEILDTPDPFAAPDGIAGIAFRRGDEVVLTERRELMDLAQAGMPAYHLIDPSYYARPTKWVIRRLPASAAVVYTGRGCPFRCGFCAANTVWSANRATTAHPVVRKRPLDKVIAELRELQDRWGFDFFYILDDTFGVRSSDIHEFCEAYRASGLRMLWGAETRVNRIDSPEVVAELRAAGCIQLDFGVETGSPRLLEIVRKQTTLDEARRAFRLCREGGLRTFANILLNLPTETEEDLELTDRLLAEMRPTVVSVGVTQPYPGTPFCETYVGSVDRSEYGDLNRLCPPEKFRLAAHGLDLTALLYRWWFRWGIVAPFDGSMFSVPARYWGVVLRSRRRLSYLKLFARELLVAPARWARYRLEYRRMGVTQACPGEKE